MNTDFGSMAANHIAVGRVAVRTHDRRVRMTMDYDGPASLVARSLRAVGVECAGHESQDETRADLDAVLVDLARPTAQERVNRSVMLPAEPGVTLRLHAVGPCSMVARALVAFGVRVARRASGKRSCAFRSYVVDEAVQAFGDAGATPGDVASFVGCGESTARRRLRELVEAGVLRAVAEGGARGRPNVRYYSVAT